MILGKRPRRPNSMKKTTSMTQLTTSFDDDDDLNTPQPHNPSDSQNGQRPGTDLLINSSSSCAPPPTPITTTTTTPTRNQLLRRRRRHSSDFHRQTTTAPFLQACNLCNRPFIPGAHDIYMYRGDSAFCSAECRQEQISQDMMMMINYSCSRPNSNISEPPTTTSGPKPKGEPPHVSVAARPVA